jgi:hypothetical protein
MKFLIDECLSQELTKIAHEKGHEEASHVVLLELDHNDDLVNQVLEVTLDDKETLRIVRYALPKE